MYVYLGPNVESPAFSSLPPVWAKAAVCLCEHEVTLYLYIIAALTRLVWYRHSKLPLGGLFVLSHCCKTLFRPHFSRKTAKPAYPSAHLPRLADLDNFDIRHERRGVCPRGRSADIYRYCLNHCLSVRKLVHIRSCWRFLALRLVPWAR